MEDKMIMNTALTLVKSACGLTMHGSIESNTKNVKNTFMDALNKYIEVQGDMFSIMETKGLYKTEAVTEAKISKTASKHETTLN